MTGATDPDAQALRGEADHYERTAAVAVSDIRAVLTRKAALCRRVADRLEAGPRPIGLHDPELFRVLRKATSDPGQYTPRGDNYTEPLFAWQARAVLVVLHSLGMLRDGGAR